MSNCYSCGTVYSGYGSVCPTCKQTEALKEQSEKSLRAQSEFAEQQQRISQMQIYALEEQNGIARRNADKMVALEQKKVDVLNYQIELLEKQANKQTKLLLEQSIPDETAYQQGFNLRSMIRLDENQESSEILNEHSFQILFDFDRKVFVDNIEPDFETPRLKIAYINGLKKRVKEEFSECVTLDMLEHMAYRYGKNSLTLEAIQSQSNRGQFYFSVFTANVEIKSISVAYHIKYRTELDSGKVTVDIDAPIFLSPALNAAFFKGLYEYIHSLNSQEQCLERLDRCKKVMRLQEEAKARNEKREQRYKESYAKWEIDNSTLSIIENVLKILGVIPTIWLWQINHEIYSFLYGVAYIASLKLKFPRENSPAKESIEKVPFYRDPLNLDPIYDRAVEVMLANNRASISLLQRHLKIGYDRAARLLGSMEIAGLVSTMSRDGSREIYSAPPDLRQ